MARAREGCLFRAGSQLAAQLREKFARGEAIVFRAGSERAFVDRVDDFHAFFGEHFCGCGQAGEGEAHRPDRMRKLRAVESSGGGAHGNVEIFRDDRALRAAQVEMTERRHFAQALAGEKIGAAKNVLA